MSNEDLIIQKSVMGLPFVISYAKYTGNIKYVKISLKTKAQWFIRKNAINPLPNTSGRSGQQ